ncbi:MAG TPA: hypothetical protein VHT91_29230 [Kofleriaceae bacterium]|nr:hypothetical protein [Kofleriaceae bacterium]
MSVAPARPLVVLDATAFCYGPISTLLAVVDCLPADALDLVLLASGTAAEFAQAHGGPFRIVPCDTEQVAELDRHADLIARAAVFVSNTNPLSARYAKLRGCRVAYIDTLFWMWDQIDEVVACADAFIVQDFVGVDANRRRLAIDLPGFHRVGPLIALDGERIATEPLALVSFGGIESPLTIPGRTNRYPWVMTPLIVEALRRLGGIERTVICGRGPVMDALAAEHGGPGLELRFLPHREYIAALRRCRVHLAAPGLTGAYEARALGVPMVPLLGQNYSQQLQVETFLADPSWQIAGPDWRTIYDDAAIPRHLPEPIAVARINELVLRFERDGAAQRRYVDLLTAAVVELSSRPAQSPPPGASRSGARDAARLICELGGVAPSPG